MAQKKIVEKETKKAPQAPAPKAPTKPELIEQYKINKRKVLELDKGDVDKLWIVESQNGYYKLFGSSAMIYARMLCPKLKKRPPKIHTDKDKLYGLDEFTRAKVVVIKNLKAVEANLDFFGIRLIYSKNGFREYKLTREVKRTEIDGLEEKENRKWEEMNEKIVPEVVWPAYYSALKEVEKIILRVGRKCDLSERALFGNDILETMGELTREYVKMANGWEGMRPEKYKAFSLESIHHIRADIFIVVNEQTVDYDTVKRLEHKLEVLEGKLLNAKI